jgi:hypothetical protein
MISVIIALGLYIYVRLWFNLIKSWNKVLDDHKNELKNWRNK